MNRVRVEVRGLEKQGVQLEGPCLILICTNV